MSRNTRPRPQRQRRKGRWPLVPLLVAASGLTLIVLLWQRETPRPWSLVVVTLDTCRADAIGAHAGADLGTGAADRLAAEGTLFERAYAEIPLTLPSHASLFTGRYPDEHGVWNNGTYALASEELTLAEILLQRGYRTAAFMGSYIINRVGGLDQGFETYLDVTRENSWLGRMPLERRGDHVVQDALEWADTLDGAELYFLWVHLFDPHAPYAPSAEYAPKADAGPRALYQGDVRQADAAVGSLMQGLRQRGLLERTFVLLTSDHGEALGEHGEDTHGFFIYEASMHVPLILWGPGKVPEGLRSPQPVQLVDLAPTLLSLLGLEVPELMSGRDLSPLLAGEAIEARPVYGVSLLPWLQVGCCPLRSLSENGWKYIDAPRPELFNLARDPAELEDLAAEPTHAERLQRLAARLERLEAGMQPERDAAKSFTEEEERQLRALVYLSGAGDRSSSEADGCTRDAKDGFMLHHKQVEATVHILRGRLPEAVRELREILELDEGYVDARATLATALLRSGDHDAALVEFQRVAAEAAGNPHYLEKGWLGQAAIAEIQGRNQEAFELLEQVVGLNPGNPRAWMQLGALCEKLGRSQRALEAWRSAAELAPDERSVRAALERLKQR